MILICLLEQQENTVKEEMRNSCYTPLYRLVKIRRPSGENIPAQGASHKFPASMNESIPGVFTEAPGQFINKNFNNYGRSLYLCRKEQINQTAYVSLGGFGGYILVTRFVIAS